MRRTSQRGSPSRSRRGSSRLRAGDAGKGFAVVNAEVTRSLNEINDRVRRLSEVMAGIAVSSRRQTKDVDEMSHAVGQVNQVTQQNAASAEESAAVAAELLSQVEEMFGMIGAFRLSDPHVAPPVATKRPRPADLRAPPPR
jgi:methyl-accepting chemotaxis protein